MNIIFDKNQNIKDASVFLKDGLHVIGSVHGVVGPGFELKPMDNTNLPEDTPLARIDGAGVFVYIQNGRFQWGTSDISGICDLFYAKLTNGNGWIIGDDFFEIVEKFQVLTIDKNNALFFLHQGHFLAGQTFFKEISRVRVGTKLKFINNNPVEEYAWDAGEGKTKPNYEIFKKALCSTMRVYSLGDRDAILFSAGSDSGLIAALSVLKFSQSPLLLTIRYNPGMFKVNEWDILRVENIAKHLGVEHVMVDFDFNKAEAASLEPFAKTMPLAAQLFLPFLQASKEAAKRGKEKLWCGQIADDAYSLSYTTQNLQGLIKRFYMSSGYLKSLGDITDRTYVSFFYRILGELGPLAFRIKKGWLVRQPKTFQEMLHAFKESEEYIVLPFKNHKFPKENQRKLNSLEAKKIFFDRKLQNLLTYGGTRAVYAAAEQNKIAAALPYSAANMLHFFRGLELNLHDVMRPKRFIYQYLEELLGKRAYKTLYNPRQKYTGSEPIFSLEDWNRNILEHTRFGQELRRGKGRTAVLQSLMKHEDDLLQTDNLFHMVYLNWAENVLEHTKKLGVVIQESN